MDIPTTIAELIKLHNAELRSMINSEVKAAMQEAMSKFLVDQQNSSTVLLKESDVVKLYKVSRSFLRKLRNEEGLPYMKIGDSIRFEKAKLDSFFSTFNKNNK